MRNWVTPYVAGTRTHAPACSHANRFFSAACHTNTLKQEHVWFVLRPAGAASARRSAHVVWSFPKAGVSGPRPTGRTRYHHGNSKRHHCTSTAPAATVKTCKADSLMLVQTNMMRHRCSSAQQIPGDAGWVLAFHPDTRSHTTVCALW